MTLVESMQRSIDYMENHLLEDVSIEEIASQANTSVFHFQRMFTLLTETPVAEYLRRRRLTLAAHELSKTNIKVIDIALKYGYDTPESFAKAFKKQHGITPREAKCFTGKMQSYNRLVIQVNVKGAEPMLYHMVQKGPIQVVGVRRELSCENGENQRVIPQLWEKVNGDGTSEDLTKLNNGDIQGLLGVCADKSYVQANLVDYWIAAAHKGEVPERFSQLELPASKWAVFEVHGPMPLSIQKVWKQIYSEWFPSSGYEHAGTPDLEVYSEGDPFSEDYYSEIWIPVK
ncbi:AraC family transcriptional regulator [Halobacillus halophilus]|uniref:AraC family transcription regulator n=1 Tax=Halobacillus halophilus (strain ATCC 35676 / DSM 2266 / JCM 20832 / KCTC 3685 / LMG 17431 / NBRC 102448 / NCIMB 2269) TaxID=866895 RepID=I0JR47_HALH3|nr:AraC family transcriptional regulator [Halobacillus halophilus]ASF40614.1 AraC family transcriptional regulator [Halobacillus halophilus]CCG46617.1 AraC family transcription regulator [Halobacillus halophilus DSM 2266]